MKHEKLISCLQNIGVNGQDLRFISDTYWRQVATLRCENRFSKDINIKRGPRHDMYLALSTFTQKAF